MTRMPITNSVKSDSDQREFAVGVRGKTSWHNPYASITAARAAYIDNETKQRIAASFGLSTF